jgi:hypothetical protein
LVLKHDVGECPSHPGILLKTQAGIDSWAMPEARVRYKSRAAHPFRLFCTNRNKNLPPKELAAILSRLNTHDPGNVAISPLIRVRQRFGNRLCCNLAHLFVALNANDSPKVSAKAVEAWFALRA